MRHAVSRFQHAREERLWTKVYREMARTEQNGKCAYCGEALAADIATADHRVARYFGGATTKRNIVAACMPCNKTKGSMSEAAFMRKVKNPKPGDGVYFFLANFRWRLWRRTEQAVKNIGRACNV